MEGFTVDESIDARDGLIKATIALAKQKQVGQPQPSQPGNGIEIVFGESSLPNKQLTNTVEGVFGKCVHRDAEFLCAARAKRLEIHCTAEVYRYLEEVEDTEFDADPLEWWRVRGGSYPYQAQLARHWLGCVATSVPSERAFSSAGNTVIASGVC